MDSINTKDTTDLHRNSKKNTGLIYIFVITQKHIWISQCYTDLNGHDAPFTYSDLFKRWCWRLFKEIVKN